MKTPKEEFDELKEIVEAHEVSKKVDITNLDYDVLEKLEKRELLIIIKEMDRRLGIVREGLQEIIQRKQ